ncbi:hypothetical protein C8R42DRAFT_638070 [Lentinula raphanica]|nr:hypothetical protein C8R42DRAFT_638070 [Lentinula raphanica]
MAKRKNSKSEKVDDPESPDAKRRKEKDIRTSSRHPVAEHSSTLKTLSSKVSKVLTANPSNSKSENDTSNSKASSSRDLRSKTSSTKASSSKASSGKASSGKLSNSKPSKKETKTTKPLSNLPASVVLSSSTKSSSQHPKKPTKLLKSKDPQESYLPTLHGIAPPKEVLVKSEGRSSMISSTFLSDLKEEKNKSGSDEEEEIDTDDGSSDADAELSNNDMDTLYDNHQQNHPVSGDSRDTPQILSNLRDLGGVPGVSRDRCDFPDDMTVKDITQPKQKKQKKSKRKSLKKGKVLESEFEDVELARLGKSSVRLAICIRNMWPKEDEPDLTLFTEELGKYGNSDLLQSLKKITSSPDPNEVKKLKTFAQHIRKRPLASK